MAAKNIQSGHFLSFDKSVNKGNTMKTQKNAKPQKKLSKLKKYRYIFSTDVGSAHYLHFVQPCWFIYTPLYLLMTA